MDTDTLERTDDASDVVNEVPEIEQAIALDAAKWEKEGRDISDMPARDGKGRFTTGADEQGDKPDGQRAAGEATEAKDGKAASPATERQSDSEKALATQGKEAGQQAGKPAGQQGSADANGKQSAWAKENERKQRTWEGINETKKAIEAEREQLKLEREQFLAQQDTVRSRATATDGHGFTAAAYETNAKRFASNALAYQQKSMEAEARGAIEEADQWTAKATEESDLAKAAEGRAKAMRGDDTSAVWARLAADLPEALQAGNAMNVELRNALRGNRELLGDPMGPYRAAVQIGRKVLQKAEADAATAKAEAAKVPELQKQIAELSERVKELTRLTSLPGGGAATVREGSDGRKFEDLSLDQMEKQLNAELANL